MLARREQMLHAVLDGIEGEAEERAGRALAKQSLMPAFSTRRFTTYDSTIAKPKSSNAAVAP